MKVLIGSDGKEIFVNEKGSVRDIHSHLGILKKEDIISAKNGDVIKSHKGESFRVLEGSVPDFFNNLKRGPAIVLLKDGGVIIAKTGIGPGSFVVEAGSGSGALTTFLANLVRPNGKIVSYELKDKFLDIAKENVTNAGLAEFVEFKNKDISKSLNEKEIDVLILDLPDPWKVAKKAEKGLKFGGYLVCYLPTINQVLRFEKSIQKSSIKILEVVDIKEERWKLGEAARPVSMQLGHTAYLVFCRKI